RDAIGDGHVDLLHARASGGFTGVNRNQILAVADLYADRGNFGDPGGEDLQDVPGFRGGRRRVLLVVLVEDPMREHGRPRHGERYRLRRAAYAIDGHHHAGGALGAQGRWNLQVDLRIARVDQGSGNAIEGGGDALAGEVRPHQGGERSGNQWRHLQGSGVQHLADDHAWRDGRGSGRRFDVQEDGDAITAGGSGIDDHRGQRDPGREGLGVSRDLHGGFVGAGWRIEDQPAGALLVDHGDAPTHAASTGVVDAEAARSTGHGAAGLDRAETDGRGFEEEFGDGDNGNGAIAEHLAIALRGDGGEARDGCGRRSGGHGGDGGQGDGFLGNCRRSEARQGDEGGELRRLLHVRVGGRHFVDRVARTVGERDFADRTERDGAEAQRRGGGGAAAAGGGA